MNKCCTCKHWIEPDERGEYAAFRICHPYDQDEFDPMEIDFSVRICKSPKNTIFERSPFSDGVSLIDGSQYYAEMMTGEDYGCVNHEREE